MLDTKEFEVESESRMMVKIKNNQENFYINIKL